MVGEVLDGRYEIQAVIARGRHGTVYSGRHRLMDRTVAVKVLKPELVPGGYRLASLQERLKALSALAHPNIARLEEFGITAGGESFLVMEYVAGAALSTVTAGGRSFTLARAAAVFSQVCAALSYAHRLGVAHGDLSPASIMLVAGDHGQETAKIVGFSEMSNPVPDCGADLRALTAIMRAALPERLPRSLSAALDNACRQGGAGADQGIDELKSALDALRAGEGGRNRRRSGPRWRASATAAVLLMVLPAATAALLFTDQGRLLLAYTELLVREQKASGNDPALAGPLGRVARLEENLHHYRQAAQAYERLLWSSGPEAGASSVELGFARKRIGDLYWAAGDRAACRRQYLLAMAVLLPIAERKLQQHEEDKARRLLETIASFQERGIGPADSGFARAAWKLADAYKSLRMYRRAEPQYRQAIRMMDSPGCRDYADRIWPLLDLAELCQSEGKAGQARDLLERGLGIVRAAGDPMPVALFEDRLVDAYIACHDYAQAGAAASCALQAWQQTADAGLSLDPRVAAISRARLCYALWLDGDRRRFDSQLDTMLAEVDRLKEAGTRAELLNYLADRLLGLGAPERVAVICRRLLKVAGSKDAVSQVYRANARRWLPLCAVEAGNRELAQKEMDDSCAAAGETATWPPVLCSDLAEVNLRLRRPKQAEELLDRAIRLLEADKDPGIRPTLAEALDRKARVLMATNRAAEAEPLVVRAGSLIAGGPPVRLYLELRLAADRAAVWRRLGRHEQAASAEKELARLRPPNPQIRI